MSDGSELQNQGEAMPAAVTPPAEKMLTQSQVNDIVKGVKQDAFEKGRQAAMGGMSAAPAPVAAPASNIGGMAQLSQADIQKMIDERAPQALAKQVQEQQRLQTNQSFIQKIEAGKAAYPDFDKKVERLNLPALEHLIPLLNSTDNPADVLYDIANNPKKIVDFTMLQNLNPQLAYEEMQKMSGSIKQNQAAASQTYPDEPLSQLKPSTTGTDNGSQTASDFRAKPYLRA